MWVSEQGQEFENFSKNAVFLISSGKKQISPLLLPVEKPLENPLVAPPWKNSFRSPCTHASKMTSFL